jgi:glycine/D-amino acid oxidase-like deaminating enzyme
MYDALIIGQGLAGSLLARTLWRRGWDLAVVDDGHGSSSSRVAAGLINPVTGQRLAKTPGVDWLLPAAEALYDRLETQLASGPLLHRMPMLRVFRSPLEVEAWDRRRADPGYRDYLGERLPPGDAGPGVIDPLGSGLQRRTGYLDTAALIDHLAEWLAREGRLHRLDLQPFDIRPRDGYVECGGLLAARAIFCEGHRAMDSPWFGWLPFQPARGDILTLEADVPLPGRILNAGRWLVPLGRGRFRFGATYFGSKGALQIPGYAEVLADHLEDGRSLPERVDVHRYADRASRPE